jgi:hypothetical protein
MNNLQICSAIFNLIDNDPWRDQYPVIHSECFVEEMENSHVILERAVWILDESDEYLFEEITAPKFISRETWRLALSQIQFSEIAAALKHEHGKSVSKEITNPGEPDIDVHAIDLKDVPAEVIAKYIDHYASVEIGNELSDWFAVEPINFNKFPSVIHPMLKQSLELAERQKEDAEQFEKRKRLSFNLEDEKGLIHLSLSDICLSPIIDLGKGIAVVSGWTGSSGSSDFLKIRKFEAVINELKSAGYLVIPLKGIFAGDQIRNSCYGVANITETEATKLIARTNISLGLYVSPNGSCKVIDLII